MKSEKALKLKPVLLALLIILLHAAVIFFSIQGYKYYISHGDDRLTKDYIKSGVLDEDTLAGMIFEYELDYNLENGNERNFSGKETYYWDGNKLVSVSEYMKGYNNE